MPKDLKIVICDRCGERFDYIPETCPKCGEILAARMDPDAKRKILETLNPPNKLRPYLLVIYGVFILTYIIMTTRGLVFGMLLGPANFALIISIIEKKKEQSLFLHFTFIGYNILLIAFLGVMMFFHDYFLSGAFIQTSEWTFRAFFVWTLAVFIIDGLRERIGPLWAINLLTMMFVCGFMGIIEIHDF